MKRQTAVMCFLCLWACVGMSCGIGDHRQAREKEALSTKKQSVVSGIDSANRFGAVVALHKNGSAAQGDIHCTGTLITPRKVLTAAHCVEPHRHDSQGKILISVMASLTPSAFVSGKPFIHPMYVNTPQELSNDVAVIVLDEAIDLEFAQPLPITSTGVDDRNPYPHNTASARSIQHTVGYGLNRCIMPPGGAPFYEKTFPIRRRYGIVEALTVLPTSTVIDGEARHYNREGDSGGPLLMFRASGYQVTGVTSHYKRKNPAGALRNSCQDHNRNSNELTGFMRVSKYSHWIQGISIRTNNLFGIPLCLEANSGALEFKSCDGSKEQQWIYEPGLYRIRPHGTDQCLQVSGTSVGVGNCSTGLNLSQVWKVEGSSLTLAPTDQVFSFEFPLFHALHFSRFVVRSKTSGDAVPVELARSTYRVSTTTPSSTTVSQGIRHESLDIGSLKFYKLHIPHPFTEFKIHMRTDAGDPDMFVSSGPEFKTSSPGTICAMVQVIDTTKPEHERWETCTITSGQAGTWYIAVKAFGTERSKYRINTVGFYAGTTIRGHKLGSLRELGSQQATTDFVGLGKWKYFRVKIPQTAVITATDLTGDVDVYVRKGQVPTLTSYDHRGYQGGTTPETVLSGTITTTPNSDWWYIGVHGYAGGRFTLKADVKFFTASTSQITEPRFAGERVDRCLERNGVCGQAAADRYCTLIGCTRSTSHTSETMTSPNTLMLGADVGSGNELPQICTTNNCRAFASIVCCGSASTCQSACP